MKESNRSFRALAILLVGGLALWGFPPSVSGEVANPSCDLCTNSCTTDPGARCAQFGCGSDYETCSDVGCRGSDGNDYEFKIDCIL